MIPAQDYFMLRQVSAERPVTAQGLEIFGFHYLKSPETELADV